MPEKLSYLTFNGVCIALPDSTVTPVAPFLRKSARFIKLSYRVALGLAARSLSAVGKRISTLACPAVLVNLEGKVKSI
jgi:hypothetical protein